MASLGTALSLGLGIASAALPYPLINGFEFSYASVEMKFALPQGLLIVKAIKTVNYKAPTEVQKIWGTHPEPIMQTVGKQDYEADIELYLSAALALQNALGGGFSQYFFDTHVTYSSPGQPLNTDVIRGCRLTSPEQSFTSGDVAGLTRKYTLNPMSMLLGGNSMLLNPLAGVLT